MDELIVNCCNRNIRLFYTRLVNSVSDKFIMFSVYPGDDQETCGDPGEFKIFTFSAAGGGHISGQVPENANSHARSPRR